MNGGFEADADVGPMITPEAKARCEQLIQSGIDQVGGAGWSRGGWRVGVMWVCWHVWLSGGLVGGLSMCSRRIGVQLVASVKRTCSPVLYLQVAHAWRISCIGP